MYVSDIISSFEAQVGHKNFPSNIDELQVLISLLKPKDNDNIDTLIGGATDTSKLTKMLNKVTGSSYNADFMPESDIENKLFELLTDGGVHCLNKNLHNLNLELFYSPDEIQEYKEIISNSNEWDYYHETAKKDTEMDLLTRAGHEKL